MCLQLANGTWQEAEREYELAIELNPKSPDRAPLVRDYLSHAAAQACRSATGDSQAASLDPVSVRHLSGCRGSELGNTRLRSCRSAGPPHTGTRAGFLRGVLVLGLAHEQAGRFGAAIEAFEKGRSLNPAPRLIGALGHAMALDGQPQQGARQALLELTELGKSAMFRHSIPQSSG